MVAMIRPTLLLKMSLDEGTYSDDVVAEIKRSYSYVSPTLVESHETGDAGCENILRFIVKIRKPYWKSSAEGSDELWNEVMLKWFKNMFYKTSSTMVAYNNIRKEKNEPTLDYCWIEIELGEEALVAIRLGADSSIPENTVDELVAVREAVNDGTLDDPEIACIRIPSRVRLQDAEGEEATEEPAEDADEAGSADEKDDETGVGPDAIEKPGSSAPVDYTVWGIEYRDGSVREFDSAERSFID